MSITDADGLAATQHILPFDAGLDAVVTIVASFAGDGTHGPASCTFESRRVSDPLPTPRPR